MLNGHFPIATIERGKERERRERGEREQERERRESYREIEIEIDFYGRDKRLYGPLIWTPG